MATIITITIIIINDIVFLILLRTYPCGMKTKTKPFDHGHTDGSGQINFKRIQLSMILNRKLHSHVVFLFTRVVSFYAYT